MLTADTLFYNFQNAPNFRLMYGSIARAGIIWMEETLHIAVVDDHLDIRDLVGKYLARQGYRVSVAESGAALKRIMEHSTIDLIVLDVMMPGEDGLSVCREIRGKSQVPIIFLTAMTEEMDRIVGLRRGTA